MLRVWLSRRRYSAGVGADLAGSKLQENGQSGNSEQKQTNKKMENRSSLFFVCFPVRNCLVNFNRKFPSRNLPANTESFSLLNELTLIQR